MKQSHLNEILTGLEEYELANMTPTAQREKPSIKTMISTRDFKVCEGCGGPAMNHPRFEVSARLYTERGFVFCCACLHEEVSDGDRMIRKIGDQIWQCCDCRKLRAWGLLEPNDPDFVPALRCGACQCVTRHRFMRVA